MTYRAYRRAWGLSETPEYKTPSIEDFIRHSQSLICPKSCENRVGNGDYDLSAFDCRGNMTVYLFCAVRVFHCVFCCVCEVGFAVFAKWSGWHQLLPKGQFAVG